MKKPAGGDTHGKSEGQAEALSAGNHGTTTAAMLAVVEIGASAGGLDAFKRFLQAVPARTGMAVEPDRVYIIPPSRYLAVADGMLRLSLPPKYALCSLADAYRERAIGIVLFGTGSHGTRGLPAIKGQDGLTMVQEPGSAEYDQMPRGAIAAVLADYILAPEGMLEALVQYVAHASRYGAWRQPTPAEEELGELSQVLALLHARTKHDFRCYRKKKLLRRVQRRMSVCTADRLDDYLERLRTDAEVPGRA